MLYREHRWWHLSDPCPGEKGASDAQDQQAAVDARDPALQHHVQLDAPAGGVRRRAPPVPLLPLLTLLACADPGLPLTVAVVGDLAPLTPGVQDTKTAAAEDLVFDHVLEPTDEGALTSALLSSWSRRPNGAFELELREDLSFSDGSPVRAADLIGSIATAGLRATSLGGRRVLAEASGTLSVEATLLRTALFRRKGDTFLGTGAYRLVSSTANELALDRVRPESHRVGPVTFRRYETATEALAAALEGRANAVLDVPPAAEELAMGTPLRLVEGRAVHSIAMFVNRRTVDPGTRKGLRRIPTEPIAAAADARPIPAAPTGPRLAVGAALHVLVPQLDLAIERAGLACRRSIESAGRQVMLERGNELVLLSRMIHGEYEVAIAPLLVWPRGAAAAQWVTGGPENVVGYSNAQLDAALARGDLAEAGELLQVDPPVLELAPRARRALIDSRVTDARLGPYGLLQSLPAWRTE